MEILWNMNCIKNAGFVYFCFPMNNGNTIKHELHKKCRICVFLFSIDGVQCTPFFFWDERSYSLVLQITEVNSNSLYMCAMSYWSSLHSMFKPIRLSDPHFTALPTVTFFPCMVFSCFPWCYGIAVLIR